MNEHLHNHPEIYCPACVEFGAASVRPMTVEEACEILLRQIALDRAESSYWTGDRASDLDAAEAWLGSLSDWTGGRALRELARPADEGPVPWSPPLPNQPKPRPSLPDPSAPVTRRFTRRR